MASACLSASSARPTMPRVVNALVATRGTTSSMAPVWSPAETTGPPTPAALTGTGMPRSVSPAASTTSSRTAPASQSLCYAGPTTTTALALAASAGILWGMVPAASITPPARPRMVTAGVRLAIMDLRCIGVSVWSLVAWPIWRFTMRRAVLKSLPSCRLREGSLSDLFGHHFNINICI